METGDLSQWTRGSTALPGASIDVGDCRRPPFGVSEEVAHTGRFAMKMTIDTSKGRSACRQYRYEEPQSGRPYFYSAWFYLTRYHRVHDFWNLIQFKSERSDSARGVFWVLDMVQRPDREALHLRLRWKGATHGPYANTRAVARKFFVQNRIDIPVRKWFHVEVYLRQSGQFGGRLITWQDGTRIFDVRNVRSRWPGGDQRVSFNAYSNGLTPSKATLYVDDAAISTTRVYGPRRTAGSTAPSPGDDRSAASPSAKAEGAREGVAMPSAAGALGLDRRSSMVGGAAAAALLVFAVVAALAPLPRLRANRCAIVGISGLVAVVALGIVFVG